MKTYLIPLVTGIFSLASCAQQTSSHNTSSYNILLKKYAAEDGVHYEKWAANKEDKEALNKILEDWSKVDATKLNKDEQAAFRINLYNATMLDVVLDNYPLKTVTKLGKKEFAIFDDKIIETPNGKISLNTLEKKQLIKDFPDARIHFAVNCASVSCPPLRAESFNAKELEKQLNEQTKIFANSDRAVQGSGSEVKYSELFNWYADDFGTKNPAEYLNKFRAKKLSTESKVNWIKYDWNLNVAK